MKRLRFSFHSRRAAKQVGHRIPLVLVWLVALAWSAVADAQSLEWGVKAGVNSSSVPDFFGKYYGPDGIGNTGLGIENKGPTESGRRDLTAGGFLSVPLTTRLALQGEVSFARKGHVVTAGSPAPRVTKIRLDYVDFSIFAKVVLNSHPRKRFYAMGGPILGVRAGEDATWNGVSVRVSPDLFANAPIALTSAEKETIGRAHVMAAYPLGSSDLLRRIVPALGIGAGVQLGTLLFEVQIAQGLTSVMKSSEGIAQAFRELAAEDILAGTPGNSELRRWDPIFSGAKLRTVSVLIGVHF